MGLLELGDINPQDVFISKVDIKLAASLCAHRMQKECQT